MLIYTKRAAPKEPKRRSRAVKKKYAQSIQHPFSLPQKKKCNEKRPQCDRCTEKNTKCEYEAVKPRKRRRTSFAGSALSNESISPTFYDDRWPGRYERSYNEFDTRDGHHGVHEWRGSSGYQYSESESTIDWEVPPGEEHEVEEIIRVEPAAAPASNTSLVRTRSQYPDLAMIAPSPVISPLLEFSAPVYMEFTEGRSRRALVDHFCNVLSHLIVFKEDTGNPFRQLVLPLSHASSPVMNAIFALSSAHLEYRGIENEEKSLTFHNRALQGLAQLIDQNDQERREEVLGAIILLVYYEVLVQRGSSNMVNGHLKGAMTIIKSGPQVTTPTSLFLERAFRFYDVIAALSLGTPPNSTTQPCASPFPSSSSHQSNGPESPLSSVDTLLGLSADLWPVIHRLSHLLSFKNSIEAAIAAGETSKAAVLRTELENASQAIEFALTTWKPPMKPGFVEEEKSSEDVANKCAIGGARMQSILNNAEAYRNSAFVYLYRTIHSHPRSHPLVQNHTHLSLLACSVVVNSAESCHDGPMSALLWPLFVASCEAITEEDRGLALSSFGGTERRQGMHNIMRTWEVVQEVWQRADLGQEEVDWRDICAERGFNIVFG
ncbi:L-arabinose-responsive transcription regulator ARA1 [Lachnellula cervina]|uniref:L-arabinose-responsive transcription regulator ARA1 n=1 Tax=Lachnellula cervina TaxID=1316786 RepID=A0A7D8YJX1_9HELO|nr:L-arabinose-responsive transcription regulator ARA1 [Lachnellula cervina]